MQSSALYRVIVVCKPDGEKTTSLVLGDKEVARNISVVQSLTDPSNDKDAATKTVDCSICHRKFANKKEAENHAITAHKSSYKCNYCENAFLTSTGLAVHMRMHKPHETFTCEICEKEYKRLEGLNLHKIREHSEVQGKFICDECGKPFHLKLDLTAHMKRAHIPEKCQLCRKMVKDIRSHIEEHKKLNKDMIDAICQFCGQKFNSKVKFEAHKKKHDGGENLKCKQCGLFFLGHRALVNHRDREHKSGTTCEICKKVFYSITNYHQHILVHAGIKPYKCDICGECFSQRSSCKRHRERHGGDLPPFDEVTKIAHLAKEYLDSLDL